MMEVNGDESGGGGVAVETARTRRADTPVHTGGRTRLLCEFTSDHPGLLQSIILVMEDLPIILENNGVMGHQLPWTHRHFITSL